MLMAVSPLLPVTERALLHRLATEQATSRIPSLVGAVMRDGEQVWFGGRGRVRGQVPTADTQYRIGSITKTFVAVLVMRLRDEGKFDLADPLDRFMPGSSIGDRTVAQLLAHTSGLPAESPGEWWERTPGLTWPELAEAIGPDPRPRGAAWDFHYSNLGFGALGELVAQVRGASWLDVLRAEILDPLGLRRTTPMPEPPHADGFAVHPWADVLLPEPAHDHVAMGPAGQLWSTANDLGRWSAFLGGDTADVLSTDTLDEMRAPSTTHGTDPLAGYGLGVQLRHDRDRILAGHGGSMPGFLAFSWADPAERTAVAVMANTTAGMGGDLGFDLLRIVAEHEPRIPEEWEPLKAAEEALLELSGPWYWGPSPYTLRLLADGWLDLEPLGRGSRASRFRPAGDGAWTGLDGYYAGETLRVVRRADGTVSHLDLATFVFTRTPYDPSAPVPGGVDPGGWR
jgi:CubicO group peptidase (beta-lactamase class C family)